MGKAGSSQKYGAPLYAAAWPPGKRIYVAGGGGKKSSGIKNRVVAIEADGEQLSDEVASLQLEDCPIRMVAHPSGRALVLALGNGGLCRIDISTSDGADAPVLTLASGEEATALSKLHVAKCLAFSSDGRLLALGGEDGALTVLDWPSLRNRASLKDGRGLPDGLRDLDFSAAHHQRVLAVTCEDGSCSLWDWEKGLQLIKLALPEDMRRGSFNRVRFARDGSLSLYTVVNAAGIGYLLHWEQNEAGEVVLKRRVKAVNSAITAFDIGARGRVLGLGTSEGEVEAWSAEKLSRLRRIKQAHMVFATAIATAPHESALVSVSADASACVVAVRKQRSGGLCGGLLVPLLVALLAIALYYILQVRGVSSWADAQKLIAEFREPYDSNL